MSSSASFTSIFLIMQSILLHIQAALQESPAQYFVFLNVLAALTIGSVFVTIIALLSVAVSFVARILAKVYKRLNDEKVQQHICTQAQSVHAFSKQLYAIIMPTLRTTIQLVVVWTTTALINAILVALFGGVFLVMGGIRFAYQHYCTAQRSAQAGLVTMSMTVRARQSARLSHVLEIVRTVESPAAVVFFGIYTPADLLSAYSYTYNVLSMITTVDIHVAPCGTIQVLICGTTHSTALPERPTRHNTLLLMESSPSDIDDFLDMRTIPVGNNIQYTGRPITLELASNYHEPSLNSSSGSSFTDAASSIQSIDFSSIKILSRSSSSRDATFDLTQAYPPHTSTVASTRVSTRQEVMGKVSGWLRKLKLGKDKRGGEKVGRSTTRRWRP
ncbi:hypothetical protein C8Q80DRAFT_1267293 [Daedaleopsis nitida]|nr:hypothetical protein C8Q80DRAFT_1267293 [Daedaleopsis nitida]